MVSTDLNALDLVDGIGWVNTGTAAGADAGTPGPTDAGTDAGTTSTNWLVLKPTNSGYCISHVDLELIVVERNIQVSPGSLEFKNQKTGTSNIKSFLITNDGGAPLTISGFNIRDSVSDGGSDRFSIIEPTLDGGIVVAPYGQSDAGSLPVKVRFAPDAEREFKGSLTITSDAKNTLPPIPLSGTGVKFATEVTPTLLQFNEIRAKKDVSLPLKVRNVGNSPITITPTSSAPSIFSVTSPSGSININGGVEQTLMVKFIGPTGRTDTIHETLNLGIVGDTGNPGVDVQLEGRATEPILRMNPDAGLAFGPQRAGSSPQQTVQVTNAGTRPITFSSIVRPSNAAFTLLSPLDGGVTLPPDSGTNSTLSLTVQFNAPSDSGTELSDSITLVNQDSNDPDYATYAIPLSGSGNKPVLRMNPDAGLAFGLQRAGTNVDQVVTVSNTGTYPITFSSIGTPSNAAFEIIGGPDAGVTLPADAGSLSSLALTVRFKVPGDAGVQVTGNIPLNNTDPDYRNASIPLSGSSARPVLLMNPDAGLAFGAQRAGTNVDQVVKVSNTGTYPITFSSIGPPSNADFEIIGGPDAGITLPADAGTLSTLSLAVRFKVPADAEDPREGFIPLFNDDPSYKSAYVIPLSGRGNKPELVMLPVGKLDFGARRAGTSPEEDVTVTNTGSRPITFSSITRPGSTSFFELVSQSKGSPGSPVTLAPSRGPAADVTNAFLTLRVRFKVPTTTEDEVKGAITLVNQDSNDPQYPTYDINLAGSGKKPNLELVPSGEWVLTSSGELDFGDKRADDNFEGRVTVTNKGSYPITFTSIDIPTNDYFTLLNKPLDPVLLEAGGGPNSSVELRVKFKAPSALSVPVSVPLKFTTEDPGYKDYKIDLKGRGIKPNVLPIPAVDFKDVVVDDPQTQTVTITNTGSGTVTFSQVFVEGYPAFSLTPPRERTTALKIGPVSSETLVVRFNPTTDAVGKDVEATLNLFCDDATVGNRSVVLKGKGIKPLLQMARDPISFGAQNVGEARTLSVTVTNPGSGDLVLSNINIVTSGAPFSVPSPTLKVPGDGGSLPIEVTFLPTVEGSFDTTLTFSTNDPNNKNLSIRLSGQGRRLLTVTPAEPYRITFDSVIVGDTAQQPIKLTNNGSLPIVVNRPEFPSGSPFSSDFSGASVTLGPSRKEYTFNVLFTPKDIVTRTANVELLRSDAYNGVISYLLTGSAAQPGMVITVKDETTANELNFGDVIVPLVGSKTLLILNSGTAPLNLGTLSVVDASAQSAFTPLAPSKNPVPSGQTAEVPVRFSPSANALYTAQLKIPANIAGEFKTFPLVGKGSSALMGLNQESFHFDPQKLGTPSAYQPVALSNSGDAPLVIKQLTPSPGFSFLEPETLPSNDRPLELTKGQTREFKLIFTPTVLGSVSNGSLSIYSNANNFANPKTLPLTASGVDGFGVTDPTLELNFDTHPVGTSTRRTIKITNTGSYPLTISKATATSTSQPSPFTVYFDSVRVVQPAAAGRSDAGTSVDTYELPIDFSPLYNGPQSAQLVIETDSTTQSKRLNIVLKGTAEGAEARFFSDLPVNFGKTNVQSTSLPQVLRVDNKGVASLTIQEITFTGKSADGGTPNPDDTRDIFSVAPSEDGGLRLPVSVDAGSYVSIPLLFRPLVEGDRKAVLTVKSNSRDITKDASGEGVAPKLTLDPSPQLDFKGVLVSRAREEIITVKNDGSGELIIDNAILEEAAGTQAFALLSNIANARIPALGFIQLRVKFTPPTEKPFYQASLTVTPVAGSPASPASLRLIGSGVTDSLSVDTELDFGKQLINNQSHRTLHITNATLDDITVRVSVDSGNGCSQFRLDSSHSSAFTVGGAHTEEVDIGFTPLGVGAVTCGLKVESAGKRVSVGVLGEGIPAAISVSSADKGTEVDFGKLRAGFDQRVELLTITNLISDEVTLAEPKQEKTTGEPFTIKEIDRLKAGVKLAQGEVFTVTVEYKPLEEKRSESTMWFGTTSPLATRTVSIHLAGEATKQFLGTKESLLEFGRVEVNETSEPKDIIVSNGSSQTQRVFVSLKNEAGAAQDALPFLVTEVGGSSGLDIPAHGSATFRVAFRPRATGDIRDEVQIKSQDSTTADLVVSVTGIGRVLTGKGTGAGGCSAGGAWGGASVLALLALSGLRSRRRRRE